MIFENDDDLSFSLNFSQDETYINYSLDFNDNYLNNNLKKNYMNLILTLELYFIEIQ